MTNPEKVISEQQQTSNDSTQQQTSNDSTTGQEISTYFEVFCKALTQLNAVALQQTRSLLDIAVTAAEKLHSLNSTAQAKNEELAGFINQLKNAADNLSQANQQTPENLSTQSAPNAALFLALVEQALSNA
ncbi:MAG TPA: hypothetical protein VEQ34_01250, partial [Pyrinomonadaceae bacterium]|nr:hypothetical protein [Pyrinomonadaceae bacterium]